MLLWLLQANTSRESAPAPVFTASNGKNAGDKKKKGEKDWLDVKVGCLKDAI